MRNGVWIWPRAGHGLGPIADRATMGPKPIQLDDPVIRDCPTARAPTTSHDASDRGLVRSAKREKPTPTRAGLARVVWAIHLRSTGGARCSGRTPSALTFLDFDRHFQPSENQPRSRAEIQGRAIRIASRPSRLASSSPKAVRSSTGHQSSRESPHGSRPGRPSE